MDALSKETNFSGLIETGLGGIAQLGERLHGMQEVRGSSPLTSTNYFRSGNICPPKHLFQGLSVFQNHSEGEAIV